MLNTYWAVTKNYVWNVKVKCLFNSMGHTRNYNKNYIAIAYYTHTHTHTHTHYYNAYKAIWWLFHLTINIVNVNGALVFQVYYFGLIFK